jgi:hypothetical protein
MTIAPAVLAPYVDDIAFAAETDPAKTPAEFVSQLEKAAYNLDTLARINGAEDLDTAVTLLTEALDSKGNERTVLLKRAIRYLKDVPDIVDEYRLMV